jgi:Zn-dependent protease/CBS domain-containing protein
VGNAFNLGKLFGIQFRLHYTWFIIFFLITISLSWQIFPFSHPAWPFFLYWVMGIITSLLFFASVVAHELAHSLVGRANGIPVKSITLFIFGGISLMTREATKAKDELLMAGAGPACSLALSGFFGLLWLFTQGVVEPLAAMALWLAYVNLMLAVFNLIPGFPLDGGRVLRSLLWRITGNYRRSTQVATRIGQGVGYLFILCGILIFFLRPFGLNWFSGLWLVFIGWFLETAASVSYRQAQWREALQRFSAFQVMTADCAAVPPNITVSQLIQGYILTGGRQCFLIADEGRLEGVLVLHNIKSLPQPKWEVTQLREIMTPVDKLRTAHPDQNALSILEQMDESEIDQMPVVSESGVIGLITRDSLMRFLRIHSELRI